MEKFGLSYIASGNIKWCNFFGQQLLKKLPYDPEIPFLGIHARKLNSDVYTKSCT